MKNIQLLNSVTAAIAASIFDPRSESAREAVVRSALTAAQMAWAREQRLIGDPSFTRLRQAMGMAGLMDVVLRASDDLESVEFSFRPGPDVSAQSSDDLLRLLIKTFRSAGFAVGWEGFLFIGITGDQIQVHAFTISVNDGPPESWQLPRA